MALCPEESFVFTVDRAQTLKRTLSHSVNAIIESSRLPFGAALSIEQAIGAKVALKNAHVPWLVREKSCPAVRFS